MGLRCGTTTPSSPPFRPCTLERTARALAGAGGDQAKKSTFDFLSIDDLVELVEFSLSQDNVVSVAGELRLRAGAIHIGSRPPFGRGKHSLPCCAAWMFCP